MTYSLKGRAVLVTAGSRGLGAVICEKFAAEGCSIAINYVSNKAAAQTLADKLTKEYGVKICMIQGDAAIAEDNTHLVTETIVKLGSLDIIVANAGWTKQTSRGDIYGLSHEEWNKCWSINVMSHLQLMQAADPVFKANHDGGVYLITSSVAGVSTFASSLGYSVTKAAGLHLTKSLASFSGPKIRVNAVLPGLLLTERGDEFGPTLIAEIKNRSVLKHETYLDDCANVFVHLAQNTSMTGQQIIVDSGLLQNSF